MLPASPERPPCQLRSSRWSRRGRRFRRRRRTKLLCVVAHQTIDDGRTAVFAIRVYAARASVLRVSLADGTLVATPAVPSDDLIPSLLALSDVMGTGWFAADAANVKPGSTVVVGDVAVGLLGVLSAKQMGQSGSSR
jgi:hypothetical protein